jgi:hypothetical protein
VKRLVFLMALAVTACSEPAAIPQAERGAVHYHQAGGALLACTTSGFDTVCRNP